MDAGLIDVEVKDTIYSQPPSLSQSTREALLPLCEEWPTDIRSPLDNTFAGCLPPENWYEDYLASVTLPKLLDLDDSTSDLQQKELLGSASAQLDLLRAELLVSPTHTDNGQEGKDQQLHIQVTKASSFSDLNSNSKFFVDIQTSSSSSAFCEGTSSVSERPAYNMASLSHREVQNLTKPAESLAKLTELSIPAPEVGPALPTRSTDVVIAELKRGRAHGHRVPEREDGDLDAKKHKAVDHKLSDREDLDSEEDISDSGPKPLKITERKRLQNAKFSSYMQSYVKSHAKNPTIVLDDDRTTEWLVKQAKSTKIITSPRDYQVELFEKAKEKNIIAVLDTGKMYALILTALITVSRFWEDTDCRAPSSLYH